MPNVAIVGTEGSGKTVFITTLAKRFSADNPLGAFMNPQGRKTIQYVEQVWHTLVNAEWPPSTSPGELFDLRWTIHWQDGLVGDIRLVDCAGQDLRLLFADEQASSESIPDHLKQLAEYCKSADVMLLMVNLKDFIGENNDERRTANEWAIKYALDLWSQKGASARIAVVFTQVDQYQDVIDRYGGWKAVIKAHLPYVYGAHFRTGEIVAMAVASVSDTQVVADGDFPRRVPARDFQSTGLNEMVKWIGKQLRSVTEEANQRQIAEQQRASLQAQNAEQARRRELDRKKQGKDAQFGKVDRRIRIVFRTYRKGMQLAFFRISNHTSASSASPARCSDSSHCFQGRKTSRYWLVRVLRNSMLGSGCQQRCGGRSHYPSAV